ncbi:hypothetical protein IGI04_021445 [Brassica rapa subsp. trilocularis]|uniref:Uncharacterized protein n=2 Tax=Brassica campestris TaxID=3711 RepID=M4DQI0_BRACM|nr:hypothetical protein IGI04_021445 [Brassica rapa subsp. trilocularis]
MTGAASNQPSKWTSELFDCMNDGENALITCFFPFITFGQIAEVIDEGTSGYHVFTHAHSGPNSEANMCYRMLQLQIGSLIASVNIVHFAKNIVSSRTVVLILPLSDQGDVEGEATGTEVMEVR